MLTSVFLLRLGQGRTTNRSGPSHTIRLIDKIAISAPLGPLAAACHFPMTVFGAGSRAGFAPAGRSRPCAADARREGPAISVPARPLARLAGGRTLADVPDAIQ